MKQKSKKALILSGRAASPPQYETVLEGIIELLEEARRTSAHAVNSIMTATYWEIGRRIVEVEQQGRRRQDYYGELIVEQLSKDLTQRFGRGFGRRNLFQMRSFYLAYSEIVQTVSALSRSPSQPIASKPSLWQQTFDEIRNRFPLSWSHYVALLGVAEPQGREFYEREALRGGWSVRQLQRQIGTQFYQRTLLSRNKAAMLTKGAQARPEDSVTPEEEIKSPFVLEFLGLRDEYSESDLEEALIRHLETFLLELGGDFTFVGRQRRLRIDDEWYRIDLLFYHRRLRCLVIIDLKLNKLIPGDVGQMHLYCNYAKDNWMLPGENPPIGLILCAGKGITLARYALEGLPNKIMAADYLTALPDQALLEAELEKTRCLLEAQTQSVHKPKKRKKPKKQAARKKR